MPIDRRYMNTVLRTQLARIVAMEGEAAKAAEVRLDAMNRARDLAIHEESHGPATPYTAYKNLQGNRPFMESELRMLFASISNERLKQLELETKESRHKLLEHHGKLWAIPQPEEFNFDDAVEEHEADYFSEKVKEALKKVTI
eukprot:TRINITY_DN2176_c1_g1_i4.p1 TRINITY_DN2176_c1_g1~~TRINITY_DN2176_c1_g1_i4.p1  ORF type:complete len:143 (+),score=40.66 TRINITY_DN2176_c1_g1_i4:66-494(+)